MNKFYHGQVYILTDLIMETHLLQQQEYRFLLERLQVILSLFSLVQKESS